VGVVPLPRRLSYEFDPTFLAYTLEDIKEHIEAVAKSRARQPKDRVTQIGWLGHVITITVRREPQS
jgi:hypothetical protein